MPMAPYRFTKATNMEFSKEQVLKSLAACANFCCGECYYKKFEHQDYTWRCVHKLIVDVNTLLTEKEE